MVESTKNTIGKFKSEYQKVLKECNERGDQIAQLLTKNTELDSLVQKLEKEKQQNTENVLELDTVKGKLQSSLEINSQLQDQIQALINEKEQLRSEYNTIQTESNNLQHEIEKLEEEKKNLSEDLTELDRFTKEVDKELNSLKEEYESPSQERDLKSARQELESDKSLKADLELTRQKQGSKENNFEENQRLKKENKNLKIGLESDYRNQESEKDELKNSFRQTVLELQSSRELNSQLQSQIQTLISEKEELENHGTKLLDNFEQLKSEYRQLEVNYNTMQTESNKHFSNFQRRIEKLEEEKKDLLEEASKYQSKTADAIDLTSDNDPSNPSNLKKDIHQLQSLLAKFASIKERSMTKINQSAADLLFEEYSDLNVKVDKDILGATIQRRMIESILQSLSNGLCQGNLHHKNKVSSLTNDDILELEIVSTADKLIELLNRFCEIHVDNDDFAKAIPGKVRQQVFSLLAKFAFIEPGNKFVNILADRLVTELDLYCEQTNQTREKLLNEAEKLVLFTISVLYFRLKAYGINELIFFESGIEFNSGKMERPDEESKYNGIAICSFPLIGLRSTNKQDIILTKAQVMLPDSSLNNNQYLEKNKGSEITQIKYCPLTVGPSSQLLKTCSLCRNGDSDLAIYDVVDHDPVNLEDLRQYQEEIQKLKKKITRKQKNLDELNEKVAKNDEILNSYRNSNEKLKSTNNQYSSKIKRAKDIGVSVFEQGLYRFVKPKPDYEKAMKDILAELGYNQNGRSLEADPSTHKASELGQTPNSRVIYSLRSEN